MNMSRSDRNHGIVDLIYSRISPFSNTIDGVSDAMFMERDKNLLEKIADHRI